MTLIRSQSPIRISNFDIWDTSISGRANGTPRKVGPLFCCSLEWRSEESGASCSDVPISRIGGTDQWWFWASEEILKIGFSMNWVTTELGYSWTSDHWKVIDYCDCFFKKFIIFWTKHDDFLFDRIYKNFQRRLPKSSAINMTKFGFSPGARPSPSDFK